MNWHYEFFFVSGAVFGALALKLRQVWKAIRRMEQATRANNAALKRAAEAVRLAEEEGRRHGLR